MSAETFDLEFPSQAHHLGTARLFAAGVARSLGADENTVDDLKIAVSEACTNAIRARTEGSAEGPVRLMVRIDGDDLSFEAEGVGLQPSGDGPEPVIPASGSTSEDLARQLSLETIRALFPTTVIVANDRGGGNLRFSLRLSDWTADRASESPE